MSQSTIFENVYLESLAWDLPPYRVTSVSLEQDLQPTYQRLGIPAGCIETLTGIVARRFWEPGAQVADLAARVARKALSKRPDLAGRIDLLVSTSVSKDFVEPSVAALVQGELMLRPECQSFDVGNACLGFMTGIEVAAGRVDRGEIQAAIVVAAESSRNVVESTVKKLNQTAKSMNEFKEALATLTLGSGAVAALLVHKSVATTTHRIVGAVSLVDPASSRACLGTADWMKTDAARLLVAGVDLAARNWAQAVTRFGWTRDNIGQFICHQVGATHMATLFKRLELDLDRAFLTYPELGNIGPAAVPLTLGLAGEAGRVRPGDRAALMGIGSGLSCTMMEVVW